jgi:hypothetical protein
MPFLRLIDNTGRVLELPDGAHLETMAGSWLVVGALRLNMPEEPEDLSYDKLDVIHQSVPGSNWVTT